MPFASVLNKYGLICSSLCTGQLETKELAVCVLSAGLYTCYCCKLTILDRRFIVTKTFVQAAHDSLKLSTIYVQYVKSLLMTRSLEVKVTFRLEENH